MAVMQHDQCLGDLDPDVRERLRANIKGRLAQR